MEEKKAFAVNGYAGVIIGILSIVLGILNFLFPLILAVGWLVNIAISIVLVSFGIIIFSSIVIITPNQARVITFLGNYMGTIKTNGMFVTIPFSQKNSVSLKVRNFNSATLKVNDIEGNPIEIAAVIVFKVVDTAKAYFDVQNYESFVSTQSEAVIRNIATTYSYDSGNEDDITLRGNSVEVAKQLMEELQEKLSIAGVQILEAQLTHLAYSPEIAVSMLQRQQAKAVLSAKQIIVDGAVGMAQLAVDQLEKDEVITLNDQTRIQLVNNLLVSIITDKSVQPVINTGEFK